MNIINCTPHAITIHAENGACIMLPSSGVLPRLDVTREPRPSVTVGGLTVTVVRPTLGDITGLPDAAPGDILVVSALVADAARRADVFSPGELVRDESGLIIGCRGLCAYV